MLRPGLVVGLLLCSTLVAAPTQKAVAGSADEPSRTKLADTVQAESALARVEAIFDAQPLTVAKDTQPERSATMALRDLALLTKDLSPDLQQRAATYFSRPTASLSRCPDTTCYRTRRVHRACTAVVCVHYVRKADDRRNGVRARDRDGDNRPDYVEKVLASVTRAHRKYVDAGYRRPVGDNGRGGDARPDIYLAQLGDWQLYGYCTTDPDQAPEHGATWAYCVLDNDYRKSEFPRRTPIQDMRVTAAHEYFHAVQFGYDIGEDAWFMEATATWVEDEVHDGVNDNVGYLRFGPMGRPHLPLDSARGGYFYGAWIFFRHVTERFPESQAGLPVIVRTMWRQADARRADAPNLYSIAAVEQALGERDSSVAAQFLQMAAANLHPRRWYDEGGLYPTAPFTSRWTLTPTRPEREVYFEQDHLASASYRFDPYYGMTASDWRLRIKIDLAPEVRGSQALVRVISVSGGVQTVVADLSDTGFFEDTVAFSASEVKGVEVVIVNASTRYNCEVGTSWSCHGRPLDQDMVQSLLVRAERTV